MKLKTFKYLMKSCHGWLLHIVTIHESSMRKIMIPRQYAEDADIVRMMLRGLMEV